MATRSRSLKIHEFNHAEGSTFLEITTDGIRASGCSTSCVCTPFLNLTWPELLDLHNFVAGITNDDSGIGATTPTTED